MSEVVERDGLKSGDGTPIQATSHTATAFGVAMSGTNLSLVCLHQVPLLGGTGVTGATLQPVAVIDMSPHAMKELHIILTGAIRDYEKDNGELTSPFIRERAAK